MEEKNNKIKNSVWNVPAPNVPFSLQCEMPQGQVSQWQMSKFQMSQGQISGYHKFNSISCICYVDSFSNFLYILCNWQVISCNGPSESHVLKLSIRKLCLLDGRPKALSGERPSECHVRWLSCRGRCVLLFCEDFWDTWYSFKSTRHWILF